MGIQSLEQMLDQVQAIAQDQMHGIGQVLPMVFCQKQSGEMTSVGYEPPPNVWERRILALEIGAWLREMGVVTYVVVHEVWMNSAPTVEEVRALPPPSKCPDRTEGVMIQAHNIITSQTRMFRIDRQGGKPKLTLDGDQIDRALPGGTWDDLLMDPNAIQ